MFSEVVIYKYLDISKFLKMFECIFLALFKLIEVQYVTLITFFSFKLKIANL